MLQLKSITNKEKYLDLILQADPDEKIVKQYLHSSEMYGLFENENIISEVIITKINEEICELKNISTIKEQQGKGYGKKIIKEVIQLYKNKYKKMIVGTTENNIPFYIKCGFDKYYKTIKNFFIDNYEKEIWDNNMQCIDMYYYCMDLKKEERYSSKIVTDLLLTRKNHQDGKIEVLLALRKNTGDNDGQYELPGGHVEVGEDLLQCMVREAKEELMIEIEEKDLKIAHILHHYTGNRINFILTAEKYLGIPTIGEPNKCEKLEWFDINNLPKNTTDKVKVSIKEIYEGIFYSNL